jgi:hypothetical protein
MSVKGTHISVGIAVIVFAERGYIAFIFCQIVMSVFLKL